MDELKQLQDNLGEFQDSEVQAAALAGFAEDLGPGTPAVSLLTIGALRAGLDDRQRAARLEFAARFARFESPSNRQVYRDLFAPGGGR